MESMDDSSEKTQSNFCAHLDAVSNNVKTNYQLILAYYVTCIPEEAPKRKAADAYCHICKAKNRRIHACLECAFFGCFFNQSEYAERKGRDRHMKEHAEKNHHYFAVNINHGCLFCFECNDYVYNKIFDDILIDFKTESRRIIDSQSDFPWWPKEKEIAQLKNIMRPITNDSYIGLRGILNTRNSCYVNCVIQVLIHNPILRDFFLTDKHECFKKSDTCLICEMFVLFQEFYSGKTIPYNPLKFFQALQTFCQEDLGDEPQDTFELFQETLIGLLSSFQETHETESCNCLIHKIFYGINQIYTECSNCKATSRLPLDHFVDILLNLQGNHDSLVEILKRKFFVPDLLFDYTCSKCEEVNTTYSSITIKKLPAVILFRMNFINSKTNKQTKIFKKKSTAFAFEEWIDMSDYLDSKRDADLSNGNHISDSSDTISNIYYLFGVIFHKGDIGGGHYVAYVKQRQNRWFECDDEKIVKRSLEEVLTCEPLLLFYYKQV